MPCHTTPLAAEIMSFTFIQTHSLCFAPRLCIFTVALNRTGLVSCVCVCLVCWYGNDSASSATNYVHKFIWCVISLWKKNARAILDQIIQQLLYPILVSAQVRWGAHLWRRRRVQNEWTWIYIYYLMYNLQTQCDDGGGRGDGSRAKGKMCCLIWNQWHPFSVFDMDHWNDASHK